MDKILHIEQEIRGVYAEEEYKRTFRDVLDIELQNKWLRTQEGKYEVGAQKAKEISDKNVQILHVMRSKLAFLAKEIYGKENRDVQSEHNPETETDHEETSQESE
jgi:hypothetical protein